EKTTAELRYNVFGATIGGPVRKDKTFFFFDYEGQRLRTGSTTTLTVPSLLQLKGDFSQTLNTAGRQIVIYDPATTTASGNTFVRQPFPNNIIPANQIDPVGAAMASYYPLPNQAASNVAGANNFAGNPVTGSPADFYMIKVDHNLSERNKIAGRYMRVSGT